MTQASPAVIVLTMVGLVAAVYAFICKIRAERVARAAVTRVRTLRPGVWQSLVADNWLFRFMSPAITIRVLRDRHGVSDPHFDEHVERFREIERRGHLAIAAAFASIALLLIGTRYWGWRF